MSCSHNICTYGKEKHAKIHPGFTGDFAWCLGCRIFVGLVCLGASKCLLVHKAPI